MAARKSYRPWSPEQPYLLPPSPRDWLPEGHLARFILEVIDVLDLSEIEDVLQDADPRGERPYDPRMMLALLVYGYSTGVFSSRKIERRTYDDVAFRYLAGGEHPEFSTICAFRRTHLRAIEGLFVQIVRLCRHAGLARLGHVSLDGTKVHANASKHKAMSYDRMVALEQRLQGEIRDLMARAEGSDVAEDARFGVGIADADLPAELQRRAERLVRIRAAKAALEEEAREARAAQLREQAERAREAAERSQEARARGRALTRARDREAAAAALNPAADDADEDAAASDLPAHQPQVTPDGLPKPSAQRNFTDPDSRIMERGGEFLQGYNCQAAVDGHFQIILAHGVSNQPPDTQYFVPMMRRVNANAGALPVVATADAGYWAPRNAAWCEEHDVDAYISTQRVRRNAAPTPPPIEPPVTPQQRMRAKVSSPEGMKIYSRRKCIPEPVFGQIKQAMGFRRFSLRGRNKVVGEWALVCTCHNVRKLWRARALGRLPSVT